MDSASLTFHALERLRERSIVEPAVILSSIHDDKVELITVEQYSNRGSYLFYSATENSFLVLVIDMSNQEVVTILPIEYWENLKAPGKEGRFLNGQSISKSTLFKAIRRVDNEHEFIKYPPLFGRDSIYFFIHFKVDGKQKVLRAGAIEIAILVGLKKNECIDRLKGNLDFSLSPLVPDDGALFVSWKTSKSKKFKFPEALQLVEFHSSIEFDRLYVELMTDLSRRLGSTKKFPEFDWAKSESHKVSAGVC